MDDLSRSQYLWTRVRRARIGLCTRPDEVPRSRLCDGGAATHSEVHGNLAEEHLCLTSGRCASFRELRFEQASSRSPLSPLSRQRCSPRQALRAGVAHAAASTRAPTPQLALPSRATKGVDASVSTRPSPPPPPALALALAHLSKGADAGTASTRFDCLPISRSLSSDEPAAAAPVPDHRPTIGVLRAEDAKWTDLLARKWTDLLPDLLADGPNLRLRPVTAFVRGVSHEQLRQGASLSSAQTRSLRDAVQSLERRGAVAITGDCGAWGRLQQKATECTALPVALTPLLQAPLLELMHIDDATLTEEDLNLRQSPTDFRHAWWKSSDVLGDIGDEIRLWRF